MTESIGTLGFIGAGAMAEALLTGFIDSGLIEAHNVIISDVSTDRLDYLAKKLGINTSADNKELVKQSNTIFLAVKPHVVRKVLAECKEAFSDKKLLISIAAGVQTYQIENCLKGCRIPVVRIMPNTPALVGESASAVAGGAVATEQHEQLVADMMNTVGKAVVLPERLLDAVTGLSGSGPAYGYLIIEALADAGVMAGLPRNTAYILAAQTMVGSAKMVLETGKHPGDLKDMVTTPGGTTIAGIHQLELGNLRATLQKAVLAATERSKQLSGD